MATVEHIIVNTVWTKITDAGESGTCWKKTGGAVVIDHTDSEGAATLPLSNTNVTKNSSKRVPLDKDDDDILSISADNVSDIYYALALNTASEKLVTDVI